ncbi:DUF6003 family protein [Streptomyces rhizosphaericola]|uniref:DUF6003 family protein n=1 Tax=Streptomyces TaxID=1883 RepID=UPI0005170EC8
MNDRGSVRPTLGIPPRPELSVPVLSKRTATPAEPSGISETEGKLVAYRQVVESRDELIREASAQGVSEARIAKLTGHSRNTVRSILGSAASP